MLISEEIPTEAGKLVDIDRKIPEARILVTYFYFHDFTFSGPRSNFSVKRKMTCSCCFISRRDRLVGCTCHFPFGTKNGAE